jgi:hypothetical protein
MFRPLITCAVGGAALLAGCATYDDARMMAPTSYECTRAGLQAAVDAYVTAQVAGDPSHMILADGLVYKEQFAEADVAGGIVNTPLAVDYHHSLLDEERCETFTEIVVTDPSHPYVLGLHLTVADGAIAEIDTIVTDDDDWLFSAEKFLAGVMLENWDEIPEDERDSRETIIAAADPYFPMFNDVSIQPPWHDWCYRQEGAMRTQGTCYLNEPLNVDFGERDYLVDPAIGAVVGLVLFNEDLPDSHLFRVVNGKVTNIHTITHCLGEFNCGFDLPENLRAEREARGGMLGPEGQ